jgi:hypothetical protein
MDQILVVRDNQFKLVIFNQSVFERIYVKLGSIEATPQKNKRWIMPGLIQIRTISGNTCKDLINITRQFFAAITSSGGELGCQHMVTFCSWKS